MNIPQPPPSVRERQGLQAGSFIPLTVFSLSQQVKNGEKRKDSEILILSFASPTLHPTRGQLILYEFGILGKLFVSLEAPITNTLGLGLQS